MTPATDQLRIVQDTARQALPDIAVQLLGNELRRVREERGWTREELVARLFAITGQQISTQTICTYELGTRAMTVARLAALCHILDARPAALWSTVDGKVYGDDDGQRASIQVDLRKVVKLSGPGLAPVREWARISLGLGTTRTVLSESAITSLATVCGVTVATITAALHSTRKATRTPKNDTRHHNRNYGLRGPMMAATMTGRELLTSCSRCGRVGRIPQRRRQP